MATGKVHLFEWSFKNLDTQELLVPPYPVDQNGIRFSVGSDIAREPRFGFQDPVTMWTQGRAKTISFSTVLYAADSSESIVAEFRKFESLAIKDEKLGRAPLVIFNHGTWLSEMCWVESVDPVIPQIRPADTSNNAEPRKVELNFNLTRYVPFSQTQVDPTKPSKESYYLIIRSVEQSYEQIARSVYGNPMLGDRLRKRHPDMPMFPTVGAKVSIPSKSIVRREVVQPEFHALSRNDDAAVANFEVILEERNKKQAVII